LAKHILILAKFQSAIIISLVINHKIYHVLVVVAKIEVFVENNVFVVMIAHLKKDVIVDLGNVKLINVFAIKIQGNVNQDYALIVLIIIIIFK